MANLNYDYQNKDASPSSNKAPSRAEAVVKTTPPHWLERMVLLRSHPRSLFINATGALWLGYFLATHQLALAIGALVLFRILAYASVWKCDLSLLRETTLGRLGILHLNPINLTVQVVGFIPLLYGIWLHSAEVILVGLSVVLLGHLFGWEKVDPRFANRK